MDKLFLCLFILLSIVHLYGCYFRKPKLLAPVTKPLLMPALLLCYLAISPAYSYYVIVALVFATIGDAFLIGHSNPTMLRLGLASFFLMQLCYVLNFFSLVGEPGMTLMFLTVVCYVSVYGIAITFLFSFVPKRYHFSIAIYMISISMVGVMALLTFFTNFSNWTGLILFGSGMFICSDFILCMEYFKERTRYGHFIVMATYIIAQICIVMGLANVGGI
ncbi:MAG: lysoplasmalogenase [Eubacteriales bacterium]|nr:lysoplasmalogenase [Eubacteriales bacterium]